VTNFSLYLFHTSLQQFKLNIANMIVSQENASFSTMNADQLFDLFQLTDVDSTKKKEEEKPDRKLTVTNVLENLEELWDVRQYQEEYSIDHFLESLK
jgi:hypothetical protein